MARPFVALEVSAVLVQSRRISTVHACRHEVLVNAPAGDAQGSAHAQAHACSGSSPSSAASGPRFETLSAHPLHVHLKVTVTFSVHTSMHRQARVSLQE